MTPAGAQLTAGASSSAAALLSALPTTVDAAVVRDGPRFVVAAAPMQCAWLPAVTALAALDELPPGWWAGFLTYELGGAVEQVSPRLHPNGRDDESALPDLLLARFPARLVLDPASGRCELHGDGEARSLLAQGSRSGARRCTHARLARSRAGTRVSIALAFEQRVGTILEHIEAGDCYQVNLTRRLTCDQAADPVALFAALDRCNPAPHGALLRIGGASGVPASRSCRRRPSASSRGDGPGGRDPPDQGHRPPTAATLRRARRTAPRT